MEGLKKLFMNPWLGVVASLLTVVGFGFAIYTYIDALASRDLNFVVDPAVSALVKAGTTSKLSVSFDGKPISTDISVAQVYIWNSGKLPLRENNILEPIVIFTKGEVPILEATVRATSRDLTKVQLDTSEIGKGKVGVSWRIFEQGDGARIQLVYAGGSGTRFAMNGTVEKPSNVVAKPKQAIAGRNWVPPLLSVVGYMVMLALFAVLEVKSRTGILGWIIGALLVMLFGLTVWDLQRTLRESPAPQSLVKGI